MIHPNNWFLFSNVLYYCLVIWTIIGFTGIHLFVLWYIFNPFFHNLRMKIRTNNTQESQSLLFKKQKYTIWNCLSFGGFWLCLYEFIWPQALMKTVHPGLQVMVMVKAVKNGGDRLMMMVVKIQWMKWGWWGLWTWRQGGSGMAMSRAANCCVLKHSLKKEPACTRCTEQSLSCPFYTVHLLVLL